VIAFDGPHPARSRAISAAVTVAAAIVIAGCGSSSSSSSIGVGQENKANETIAKAGGATAPTPTTPATPTSGPLSKEPAIKPPSGPPPGKVVVKDIVTGTGAQAKVGSSITVNYVGALYHGGSVFDASWKHGEPVSFALTPGSLIAGWIQGIPGMKVGGRRELIIPSALAYGPRGRPPTIPPNAPLVFVVDLLGA
jgi:peptidylprolyl isomerase